MDFDVFIAHASEDKEVVARPLADALDAFGLTVWFDEKSIMIGDSLSREIDRGLARSRFAVVVLSKAFMRKPWPDYEFRGLVAREIGASKVVLPVWYDVERDDVMSYSPPLADKLAARFPKDSIGEIALQLLAVIDPMRARHVMRYLLLQKKIRSSPVVEVPHERILLSPIRHQRLPAALMIRIRLFSWILGDVTEWQLSHTVDNFRRDADPVRELEVWERIANAYITLTQTPCSTAERKAYYASLLELSLLSSAQLASKVEVANQIELRIVDAFIRAAPEIELEEIPETES